MAETLDNGEHGLYEQLKDGHPGAIEELFTRYFRQVYSVVFHAVGQDRSAAEDVTQDTFISAARSAVKYKGKSAPYTWLLGIAHHKIADHYRRRGKQRRYEAFSLESSNSTIDNIPDGSDPLHHRLESAEANETISQALAKLPYHYREVLIYKYVEEMPVKQISQIMERSPKSIEALLARARNTLKSEFEKSEG